MGLLQFDDHLAAVKNSCRFTSTHLHVLFYGAQLIIRKRFAIFKGNKLHGDFYKTRNYRNL